MIFDQSNTDYSNSGTINEGATIAASGIRLTNTDSGRIYTGVTFVAGGSTFINELGGAIRLTQFDLSYDTLLVSGSDGADTVVNAGLIGGLVALGGGADTFVDRDGLTYDVDLGSGDDTYRLEGVQSHWLSSIKGGDGYDRFVLANSSNQVDGAGLVGFEALTLEIGGNISNFSGYQSITITGQPAPNDPLAFFNLLDCLNPTADLAIDSQWLILQRSSLRSIIGNDTRNAVELGPGSTVANGIFLGGGDDGLTLSSNQSAGAVAITFPADGGSGSDTLTLNWFTGGDRSYDLSSVQGFEKLNVNSWYVVDPAIARVSNISGLTDIDIGRNATLVLSGSISPNARAGGGFGGGLTLEAGTVISRYGFPEDGPWDSALDKAQGDPALSTNIINHGTINGDVRFYIGDDLYDGRDGSVGGTVYGNAGNDTLLGGAGAETMQGGYGADILEGNGGADTLTGGAGADVFRGTTAGLNSDTIADFGAGDKIVITNATLAGFTFSLSGTTLTYTGGWLTLSAPISGTVVASAASGGGVQLTIPAHDVRNDFNGDGRSDVLLRHDNGWMTEWLGQLNGSFSDNGGVAGIWTHPDWQVAAMGDFNGDTRDDLLLRHSDGTVTERLGQANGSFVANGAANTWLHPAWEVAMSGDFNGDSRDDLLLRHSDGTIVEWLGQANGSFAGNGAATAWLHPAWDVANVGDFNGDSRDDLLLRHSDGMIVEWLGQANGSFASNGTATVWLHPAWEVAATGDFNGDSRDDLLLRHSDGTIVEWLGQANGSFAGNGTATIWLHPAWEVASAGDFNGDTRDDLLLRHDDGTVVEWLGQMTGGFLANNAATTWVHPNWHTQPPNDVLL